MSSKPFRVPAKAARELKALAAGMDLEVQIRTEIRARGWAAATSRNAAQVEECIAMEELLNIVVMAIERMATEE